MLQSPGSVTFWLARLQHGDRQAVTPLWERFFDRLVGYARGRMGRTPRAAADEEDAATNALYSFFRRAEQGQFPELAGRDDLWRLLVTITARKVANQIEHECCERRDVRRRQEPEPDADAESPLERVLSREPDPAFLAGMADQCRHLLDALGDEQLRDLALLKLEGHTNQAIADRLDVALSTVERRLALIRERWAAEAADTPACE
jgi:DNA-directed RNA polymerase specialized sigma24 family protein